MTPEAAINLLDKAVATLNVNRQSHIQLTTAIDTLDKYVKDNRAAEAAKKKEAKPVEVKK